MNPHDYNNVHNYKVTVPTKHTSNITSTSRTCPLASLSIDVNLACGSPEFFILASDSECEDPRARGEVGRDAELGRRKDGCMTPELPACWK